jgi:hypothetical protein
MEVLHVEQRYICPGLRRAIDQGCGPDVQSAGLLLVMARPSEPIPDQTTNAIRPFDHFVIGLTPGCCFCSATKESSCFRLFGKRLRSNKREKHKTGIALGSGIYHVSVKGSLPKLTL